MALSRKTIVKKTRRGAGKTVESEIEVEETPAEAAPAAAPMAFEMAVVFVTTVALLVGLLLIHLEMKASFGSGLI